LKSAFAEEPEVSEAALAAMQSDRAVPEKVKLP